MLSLFCMTVVLHKMGLQNRFAGNSIGPTFNIILLTHWYNDSVNEIQIVERMILHVL